MRVAFCVFDADNYVSGPTSWLQRLLPELRRHGVESRVLCTSPSPTGGPMVRALRAQDFEVVLLPLPASTRQKVRMILADLASSPPDVFVPGHMVVGLIASRFVKAAGVPTVVVVRSDDDFYRAVVRRFVAGASRFRPSAVVCVSDYLRSRVEALAIPGMPIARIPSGSPVPDLVASPPRSEMILAYVGRLVQEQKRVLETVQALCRATQEIEGTKAVVYGDGPARPLVEELLTSRQCASRVRLAGAIATDQVQQRLLESHALVLLSDYEGLPTAVVEAMACGVVPICLKVDSGVPELLDHGVNGLVVSDRDDSFVQTVRRLSSDPALWQRLSSNARATVVAEYSTQRCADQWWELLSEIASATSHKRPIHVPAFLRLPPFDRAFAREDFRWRPLPVRALSRLGRIVFRRKETVADSW